jgi:Swi5-dependent recombination DNA repair protein 1
VTTRKVWEATIVIARPSNPSDTITHTNLPTLSLALPNAPTAAQMSTPTAKRRRLNDATNTLKKPFKSPFRTPLKASIGDDPPSSDPPELHTPAPAASNSTTITGSATFPVQLANDGEQQPATVAPSKQPPATPAPSKTRSSKPLVSRPNLHTPSRVFPKKIPSKPSLAREIMELRNEITMLKQAQSLATSTQDDDLVQLVDRWRTASRSVAEELFGSTRDRVNRMGGVGAWKERENESKERQMKWDQEEMEAERVKMEEAKESGEVSAEAYDRFAEMEGEREKPEEEKETFKGADDDVSSRSYKRGELIVNHTQSFTMDMMLKTLNIDLKLIGYNKEAQRWDG